jgi:hypothetical protein
VRFFSSWFLHLLLQPLDLMIHQKRYGVSHYLRQMDNFTIFGSNKRKLKKAAGGHSGVACRGRAETEGELADLPHGLYAKGDQSPRGPAGEEAAAPASKAPIRAGIPFRAWIYDPPKAQPVSAQTGATHLLSQKRPELGHLIQEGLRFDLTTGATAKMQQSANIRTALPTENQVRPEKKSSEGNVGGCNDYTRPIRRHERSGTMKVQGMTDPGRFTVEEIPGTGRSLVRLFQNAAPVHTEDFEGFEYDEYHVEVQTWPGLAKSVQDNYEEYLKKGKDNEVDRSNAALFQAQTDTDAMVVDQEFRITMFEIGLTGL